jgi:endoribonuclease Nob1
MKAVLDTSFFFYDLPLEGDLFTTHSVCDELIDIRSKGRFEKFCALGLQIASPRKEYIRRVTDAASRSGDTGVISDTDRDLLALALELDAVLYTDDFAIQNVAARLGVRIEPMHQRKAKKITWRYRCSGCGRYSDHAGECLICGSEIKRKLK